MKQLVCSIYDVKSGVYSKPFFEINNHTAERAFRAALTGQGSMFNTHPQDFILYQLAEFDDTEGTFTPCLEQIRQGAEIIKELPHDETNRQTPLSDVSQVLRSS